MGIKSELRDFRDLVGDIRDAFQGGADSLPAYIKKSSVMSRIYIENSLIDEPVTPNLVSMLNQIYTGYILTALQLNQFVANSKTVRDLLKIVSSEAYTDTIDVINSSFLEPHLDKKVLNVGVEAVSPIVELDAKTQRLFAGKVVAIDFTVPNAQGDKPTKITAHLYVQLLPYVLRPEVISEFVNLNFETVRKYRWLQVRAGEISFVKDFLFEMDLIKKREKALKADNTGVLYEMLKRQNNALSRKLGNYIEDPETRNVNTANTIMVVDKRTFARACSDKHINFDKYKDRQVFFKKSFMMMVVAVDVMYNTVEIYYNGIESKGEYNFRMIEAKASANEKYDLKDIMKSLSMGSAPRI